MYSKDRAEGIIEYVSNKTQISVEAMKSPSRKREIVTARQCAIWIIKKDMNEITLSQLASHFGNRHHSTIIHSLEAVEDQVFCNNPEYTWVKKDKLKFSKLSGMKKVTIYIPTGHEQECLDEFNNVIQRFLNQDNGSI
jgi:hypothetical protein